METSGFAGVLLKPGDKWYTPAVKYRWRGVRAQRSRLSPLARGDARFDQAVCYIVACTSLYLALSWAQAQAQAQAQALTLSWHAPRGCPDAASGRVRIDAVLGSTAASSAAPITAHVRIARVATRYQLSLSIGQAQHRAARVLRAARCSELADTAAWLIAVAMNPALESAPDAARAVPASTVVSSGADQARATASEASSAAVHGSEGGRASSVIAAPTTGDVSAHEPGVAVPTGAAESRPARAKLAPESQATASTVAASSASNQSEARWPRTYNVAALAGLFAGAASALQASVGAQAGIGVGWSYSQLRLSGLLPHEANLVSGSARVWSLALDATQCAMWGGAVRAGPCLGFAGLRTAANVSGLPGATDRVAFWSIASAGLQLFWRLPRRLALVVSAAAGMPISRRPRFVVEGLGTVASARTWSFDGRLGLAFYGP